MNKVRVYRYIKFQAPITKHGIDIQSCQLTHINQFLSVVVLTFEGEDPGVKLSKWLPPNEWMNSDVLSSTGPS